MTDLTPARQQAILDEILEAIVTPDATPYGAAIRNKGRDALKELLAALDAERARNRNLEAVAEAAQNFTGEMGHSHACEFRKYDMGWKKGDPPIIRCVCGLKALDAALAVLEEPQ